MMWHSMCFVIQALIKCLLMANKKRLPKIFHENHYLFNEIESIHDVQK